MTLLALGRRPHETVLEWMARNFVINEDGGDQKEEGIPFWFGSVWQC